MSPTHFSLAVFVEKSFVEYSRAGQSLRCRCWAEFFTVIEYLPTSLPVEHVLYLFYILPPLKFDVFLVRHNAYSWHYKFCYFPG